MNRVSWATVLVAVLVVLLILCFVWDHNGVNT